MSELLLSCKNIYKSYDDIPVLEDVSLELHRGEIVAILGKSGSGKSTLFNLLAGLDTADSGQIERKVRVGYMMQKDLLLDWKTVLDNIALPLILRSVPKEEARATARKYMPVFGLEGLADRWPATLSGGQRQRSALMRTWLYSQELMLLDEPFSGLDALTREALYEWLQEHKEELGLSILLITHSIEEAISLADRLYILKGELPSQVSPSIEVPLAESGTEAEYILERESLRRQIRAALVGA
ncbi:MAG: ATP-binding cassette domain-containing protein [Eubacteriales bacterium]|nr:ATP-binding cassette domain-containing protein [Eubacteriales bacterium]MDD4324761.1 ATP-binding cassette domain-containing protein [Eubacteriales bacterium]MDD4542066.1 ATP-binding cassette domain-containing protein [Eubacteriales bacterium]